METFLIDRTQGQNIRIDVHKGKVKRIYNGNEVMMQAMNDKYKGKSISYLREDFEASYSTYVNVRPEAVLIPKQIIHAINALIADNNNKILAIERTTFHDHKKEIEAYDKVLGYLVKIKDLEERLVDAKARLQTETERILKEHKFETELQTA